MRFYFASRVTNIRELRPKSLLSSDASLVYNLNRFDYKTGKKWVNEDLDNQNELTREIKLKKNRVPTGHPCLYKGVIFQEEIEKIEKFPKIFKNKEPVFVEKITGPEYVELILSKEKFNFTNFN